MPLILHFKDTFEEIMEVEQESLDLIEPTQDHVETENIEMSEEIQFDSEKTDTEPQNDKGNFLIDQMEFVPCSTTSKLSSKILQGL